MPISREIIPRKKDAKHQSSTDTGNTIDEVKGRIEFNRPVPQEYFPLIEKVNLEKRPSQSLSKVFEFDVFGVLPENYNLSDAPRAVIEKSLQTEPGIYFRELIQGRDFVDLGCGYSFESGGPLFVASALRAQRYIGVDRFSLATLDPRFTTSAVTDPHTGYAFKDAPGPTLTVIKEGFESTWVQDDMLGFVSKMPETEKGVVFYMANIEDYPVNPEDKPIAIRYFDALGRELSRVTHSGDAVIFVGLMLPFYLYEKIEEHGFRRMTLEEIERVGLTMSQTHVLIKE